MRSLFRPSAPSSLSELSELAGLTVLYALTDGDSQARAAATVPAAAASAPPPSRKRLSLSSGAAVSAGASALALLFLLGGSGCTSGTSNPAGDGGTSSGDGGTSTSDGGTVGGPVSISDVLPGTGLLAGGEVITVVGDGFAAGATVLFGDRQGSNVQILSKTQLKVTVPAGAAIGPVVLVVKNPDGTLASSGSLFSYIRVRVLLGDDMNPTYLPVGQKPVAVAAADLDGDGKPDLITANESSGDVTLLKNNQNFLTPNSWNVAVGPTGLVVAELDGRSGLDVAVTCNNGDSKDVGVLLNSGSGNLQAVATFAAGRNPTGIVARDLTGDGKAELILGVRTSSQAQVLNNNTAGTTPSFSLGTTYALGTSPAALLLAELTGDTYPELLSANEAANSVSVYLGAAGMFQSKPAVGATGRPLSLAAGDLTGDGKADLIVPGYDSQQVNILRGKGDGTFDTLTPVAVGRGPRAASIADIDGDGKLDALVLNSAGNTLDVLLGKGDGTFEPTQRMLLTATPYAMTVADLNADGKPDVAVASYDGNRVILLTNRTQR